MNKYVELAIGRASHQGTAIPYKDLMGRVKGAEPNKLEVFKSMYYFDEKILAHFGSDRLSPSGYIGNYYIDEYILDIDRGKDTDVQVLHRGKLFVEKLCE